MTYNQGDIVLVPFPFSDNSKTKLRPAIIISNSKVNGTKEIILAQITSTIRRDGFSFLLEDKLLTRNLDDYCEIRCHKLFTADKNIVVKKISSLKSDNCKKLIELIVLLLKS